MSLFLKKKAIKARRNDNIGVAAIKNNGILYHDSKTKAELLNHQFKSVFTMDDDTGHLPTMSHPKYPNIENIVYYALKGLKCS